MDIAVIVFCVFAFAWVYKDHRLGVLPKEMTIIGMVMIFLLMCIHIYTVIT